MREFQAGVAQPDMTLVVFFCSVRYDLDVVASEMKRRVTDVQVIGCPTAGEIGPAGHQNCSIFGASFLADNFASASGRLDRLQQSESVGAQSLAQDMMQQLEVGERFGPWAGRGPR